MEAKPFEAFDISKNALFNDMVINPFLCKAIAVDRIFDVRFASFRVGITPLIDVTDPDMLFEKRSPGIGISVTLDFVDYLIDDTIHIPQYISSLSKLPFNYKFLYPNEEVEMKAIHHEKLVVCFDDAGSPSMYAHNITPNKYSYFLNSVKNIIEDKKNEMLQKNIVQTFMMSLGALGNGMKKTPSGIEIP